MKMLDRSVGWSRAGVLVAALAAAGGCGGGGHALPVEDASAESGGGPGTGGAGGTGGTTGSGGIPGTGGAIGGTTGTGGAGPGSGGVGGSGQDGGTCDCGAFAAYRSCCGDRCVNLQNDPLNCGACGNRCPADKSFCDAGACTQPPCDRMSSCGGPCCGTSCCEANQICCNVPGPIGGVIGCYTPTAEQPSCSPGCAPLCRSDRNLKHAIAPVDPQDVLRRLTRLPVSEWTYLSEPPTVRHMGPMAQDFKQAFGLGDTDRGYYSVDAHGVALAAIQALQQNAERQQRRIEQLERERNALERRLEALEKRRDSRRP